LKIAEHVHKQETKEIDKKIDRILLDLGSPSPPLSLLQVRELLKLDLQFYSGSDPSIIDMFSHKLKVAGKQIAKRPALLLEALRKLELKALWIPDSKRILIDADIPQPKHRWIEGHEISHSIIPWHEGFVFGDNKTTLSPACDEIIEAEANYAAGRLLFLGDRFSEEARDLPLNFKSIKYLYKEFGNTMTTTLWRMVEARIPHQPVFGMISCHPNHPSIGKSTEQFIRSTGFRTQFSNILPSDISDLLKKHASYKKRGPIVDVQDVLFNTNGERVSFRIESFCNTYDLLTIGYCESKQGIIFPAF